MNRIDLNSTQKNLRLKILRSINRVGVGHYGACYSAVDMMYIVYKYFICPFDSEFILSKAHAGNALYAVLNTFNYLSDEQFDNYGMDGSYMISHTSSRVSGISVGLGALGLGLSVGIGRCLARNMDKKSGKIIVMVGDGELNEGSIWEAVMFAGYHRIYQLILIVDRNRIQASDFTANILDQFDYINIFKEFKWHAIQANGHDYDDFKDKMTIAMDNQCAPVVIVANTVKGFGVTFMENDPSWHSRKMTSVEYEMALNELRVSPQNLWVEDAAE